MNQRDVELLSSYLDGQLKPSDSARLEERLKTERELVSVMDDLRAARNLLRQLPQRRAPRNFTLTRKMVGQNPPMPRAYPIFRFATTLATLLLFFTFGLNFTASQLAASSATGMGGGGDVNLFAREAPAAAESVATEAPATEAAAAEPPAGLAPAATQMPPSEDAAPASGQPETPSEKNGDAGNSVAQDQPKVPNEAQVFSSAWQIVLAGIAVVGALLMLLMRQATIRRWRQKG